MAVIPINDSIDFGVYQNPTTLYPHEVVNDVDKMVSKILYYDMFEYQGNQLSSRIFESWTINDENTVFTLKIKDIKWQNGKDITSQDVLYTLSNYPDIINQINISIISPKEIEFSLSRPNAILLENLVIPLEPNLKFKNRFNIIGSTDYHLVFTKRKQNDIQELIFINKNFNAKLKKISIKVYPDIGSIKTAYQTGEINSFVSSTPFLQEGVSEYLQVYKGRYNALALNTTKANLASLEIRKKLNDTIDKLSLKQISYFENVNLINGPIQNNILFDIPTAINSTSQKFTTEELEKIGKLKVVLPDNSTGKQVEGILSKFWQKEQNIDIEILFESEDKLLETAKNGNFDVIFVGQEITKDPDQFAYWHSSQTDGGLNFSYFEDAKLDKALEEGRKTRNIDERKQHYIIFNEVIFEKTPAIFLYNPSEYFYISNRKSKYFTIQDDIYYPWEIFNGIHSKEQAQ